MDIMKIKNKKMLQQFEAFYKKYSKAKTEAMEYALLKDFTLSLSLDELLAWNGFVGEKLSKATNDSVKNGLTDEDHVWFKQQFAKFDALEAVIRPNAEQRRAA
jgi:hypothetical protein